MGETHSIISLMATNQCHSAGNYLLNDSSEALGMMNKMAFEH